MSYALIRDGVLAVARGATGFSATNVVYNDFEVLNRGTEDAAVLVFTSMEQVRDTFAGGLIDKWSFNLRVFTGLFGDVEDSRVRQDTNRNAMVVAYRKYPLLNGVSRVLDARVVAIMPEGEQHSTGDAAFWSDAFTIVVDEDIAGTELE